MPSQWKSSCKSFTITCDLIANAQASTIIGISSAFRESALTGATSFEIHHHCGIEYTGQTRPKSSKLRCGGRPTKSLHVVLFCITLEQHPRDITYSFIPALDPHWDRLRSVDIVLPAAWMGFVRTALRKPSLNLERLSLTDEEALSSAMEIDVFGGTAPRLNGLTLNGVSIRWDSPVLYDLVVLNLSTIDFPSTTTILHVLSHSPRLRSVAIRHCFINSVAKSSSPFIQLPQLTSLELDLGSLDATENVLGHIEDPGQCSLTTFLHPKEAFGDFLQQRLLERLSKWKFLALVPFEGLLLAIDGGSLRVELSTADRSEPLALAIEGLGDSWAPPISSGIAKHVRNATFSLGRFGAIINVITVLSIAFAIVLFTMPTAIPVTPVTMNYASVVFAGFTLISAIWYAVWGRTNYRGPKVSVADMGLAMNSDEGVVKQVETVSPTPPEKQGSGIKEKQ